MTETPLVFLDVETTGLSPKLGDRIVEIAALRMENFKEVSRFESLINPQRSMSYSAYLVNGISDEMLREAPTFNKVILDLFNILDGAVLIGHNLQFDIKFINSELSIFNQIPLSEYKTIDTLKLTRVCLPHLRKYSLSNISKFLGVDSIHAHRAMDDVVMTSEVFKRLLKIVDNEDIDISLISSMFGIDVAKKKPISKIVNNINKSIKLKKELQLVYNGDTKGIVSRKIQPREVLGQGETAVLIGFCYLRNKEKSFKLDRILQAQII